MHLIKKVELKDPKAFTDNFKNLNEAGKLPKPKTESAYDHSLLKGYDKDAGLYTVRKEYLLNDGQTVIPSIGLGTVDTTDKDTIVYALTEAGYSHIHTSTIYDNEELIAEALQEC